MPNHALEPRSVTVQTGDHQLSFRPLWPTFGAIVSGIDLAEALEPATRRALYEAFLVYGALLFEDQDLDPAAEERAFTCFDGIDPTNLYGKDFRLESNPAIRILSNIVKPEGRIGIVMGKQGPEWHCDGTSSPRQPVASQLYCLESNDVGGDTLFASGAVAYETLPESFRRRLDPMVAVYNSDHLQKKLAVYDEREIQLSGSPDVEYPIVLAHPETGRRAIYFAGGEMVEIKGLSEEERVQVVAQMSDHLFNANHLAYSHHWVPGQLLVWDNRTIIHSATFYNYAGHPRLLHHICGSGQELSATGVES
jgi:taurine dioxygenase